MYKIRGTYGTYCSNMLILVALPAHKANKYIGTEVKLSRGHVFLTSQTLKLIV